MKIKDFNRLTNQQLPYGYYDHMGYAFDLVNNFKVKNVMFNCGEFNELKQDLINVLDKKKIPYYSCVSKLNIDDTRIYRTDQNGSIIFKIKNNRMNVETYSP